MVDGNAWRRHRKIASTEFSTRKLREHSNSVFREDAIKLAIVLKQAMVANKTVEFQVRNISLDSDVFEMHLRLYCRMKISGADMCGRARIFAGSMIM